MTQAILNPVKLPSPLLPAEVKFVDCLAKGERCIVGNGQLPDAPIESGNAVNVIRPEIIHFFAFGGDEKNPIRGPSIELLGAWICGKRSLNLAHADIPRALFFGYCHFAVPVVMIRTECVALYLNGSRLTQGVQAGGLTTKGGVYLREGFSAEGMVQLVGANIGGDLDCTDGKIHNPKKLALSANRMTTKGDVFLRGFSAKGEVRLVDANIGGNLHCEGGTFDNPKGYALNVNGSNINGGLLWREKVSGSGIVNLGYSQIRVLADDMDLWKPFKVILDGFNYDRFSHPADAKSRIEWLDSRPDRAKFSPQPYEQAAKALFRMGHDSDARKILLKKEQKITGRKKWWHKLYRWPWGGLAGYGYKPARTLLASFLIIIAGWGIFWLADYTGRIVPHQPTVLANVKYQYGRIPSETPAETVARKLPGYPEFSPFWFSLDIFVPLFNLHQEPFWYPSPDGGRPHWWRGAEAERLSRWLWLEWWYWIQIGAGWILTSLFLLSVTGLLRPRQSSGGKD